MEYIAILDDRRFAVESDMVLSPEQVNSYAAQAKGGMVKLGTATCGGPYLQNSSHTLTGSVTTGGTAPFTYTWTITKPDTTKQTLTGASQTYVFAQVGTYAIRLDVSDSCPAGAKTDYSTCSVTVTAPCVNPVCNINIA